MEFYYKLPRIWTQNPWVCMINSYLIALKCHKKGKYEVVLLSFQEKKGLSQKRINGLLYEEQSLLQLIWKTIFPAFKLLSGRKSALERRKNSNMKLLIYLLLDHLEDYKPFELFLALFFHCQASSSESQWTFAAHPSHYQYLWKKHGGSDILWWKSFPTLESSKFKI